jgi:hypothetical protein
MLSNNLKSKNNMSISVSQISKVYKKRKYEAKKRKNS